MFFTKASCQAWLRLLFANEVRIGGPGGGRFKLDHFEALPQLNRVASGDGGVRFPPGPSSDVHWGHGKRALGATGMEGEMEQERSFTWSTSAASALQLLCKLLLSRTIAPFLFISIL